MRHNARTQFAAVILAFLVTLALAILAIGCGSSPTATPAAAAATAPAAREASATSASTAVQTPAKQAASPTATTTITGVDLYVKAMASLKDEPVVYYWTGMMYRTVGLREATPSYPATGGYTSSNLLFKVEGFNIRRAYRDPALPLTTGGTGPGWAMLTREMMFYLDPKTGKVLDKWDNPYYPVNPDGTGGVVTKTVQVLHVQNDPVNSSMPDSPAMANMLERMTPLRDDGLVVSSDVFLNYASPLAKDPKYARFSANDSYQATEMFRFVIDKQQLLDPSVSSAGLIVSWARMSQYLPWMQMGQAPGGLVVDAIGYKVPNGFEGLPTWMKQEVRTKYPKFAEPPSGKMPVPNVNETSWTYFKKEFDAGRWVPAQ